MLDLRLYKIRIVKKNNKTQKSINNPQQIILMSHFMNFQLYLINSIYIQNQNKKMNKIFINGT